MDLDIASLRAFVATADEQHFGRAAERLVISQQALSKRIQRLEQLLGVSLFDRTNRRVELTETGRRLLPHRPPGGRHRRRGGGSEAAKGVGPLRIDVLDEHLAPMLIARQAALRDPGVLVEARTRTDHHDAITALLTFDVDVAFGRAGAVGSLGRTTSGAGCSCSSRCACWSASNTGSPTATQSRRPICATSACGSR